LLFTARVTRDLNVCEAHWCAKRIRRISQQSVLVARDDLDILRCQELLSAIKVKYLPRNRMTHIAVERQVLAGN
jgi:hypothetical protein